MFEGSLFRLGFGQAESDEFTDQPGSPSLSISLSTSTSTGTNTGTGAAKSAVSVETEGFSFSVDEIGGAFQQEEEKAALQ